MKRIHVALVFAAVLALTFASVASAAPSNGTVELNAGYSKSSNEVTTTETMGGGISFGAGYWRNASPQISWGLEAGLDNLGKANDNTTTPTTEFSSSAFRVNPALRFNFGRSNGPAFYAQGGAGLYNVSFNVKDGVNPDVSDSQSKFGFNLGAGVSIPVSPKSRANFTGLYHSVSTDGQSLNYLQFRAGIGFNL